MISAQKIKQTIWTWLDDVAEVVIAIARRLAASSKVRLVEEDGGHFAIQLADLTKAGRQNIGRVQFKDGGLVSEQPAAVRSALRRSRIDIALKPHRFLFKPVEFPLQAAEFLDGIVRAQIDRLTPWSPEQAVFACSKPQDSGGGRIAVTVAATARSMLTPFVPALVKLGVRSVAVSTTWPEPSPDGSAGIEVWRQNIGDIDAGRTRRALVAILAVCALIAASAIATAAILGNNLQEEQDSLARRIGARRAAMLGDRTKPGDPKTAAERELGRRKNATPSAVIVLEILSQILPDHTYVTELRMEGDKLRLNGMTQDAPSLIRLIEQSRHFTQATFFAPTTHAPSDKGDRFNIEAQIAPVFSTRP